MAINFIYDQNDDFSNEIINAAFNHFSYDFTDYFSVDLGIPINLYGNLNDIPIVVEKSDITVFLITNGVFTNSKYYIRERRKLNGTYLFVNRYGNPLSFLEPTYVLFKKYLVTQALLLHRFIPK